MAEPTETEAPLHSTNTSLKRKRNHKKLTPLPPNATIHKRPLHHPTIPSPYSNSTKIIYISTSTPFLSAVKRTEKLLKQADKRLVQSATTHAKHDKRAKGEQDEILEVAKRVEEEKKDRQIDGSGEDGVVILKGTGKAIQKVMELGLWFQQREEYVVRLRTGSVGAIDDIVVGAEDKLEEREDEDDAVAGAEEDSGDGIGDIEMEDGGNGAAPHPVKEVRVNQKRKKKRVEVAQSDEPVPETRIRHASVLEVIVRLR